MGTIRNSFGNAEQFLLSPRRRSKGARYKKKRNQPQSGPANLFRPPGIPGRPALNTAGKAIADAQGVALRLHSKPSPCTKFPNPGARGAGWFTQHGQKGCCRKSGGPAGGQGFLPLGQMQILALPKRKTRTFSVLGKSSIFAFKGARKSTKGGNGWPLQP